MLITNNISNGPNLQFSHCLNKWNIVTEENTETNDNLKNNRHVFWKNSKLIINLTRRIFQFE